MVAEIESTGLVPAPPEDVFEFLSDLEHHWRLVDRFVQVRELDGPDGQAADGGVVRLRGPLGVRRTARTRVTESQPPRLIIGTAEMGSATRAVVSWTLEAERGQTRVRLAASVERAGTLDRLLLALGGRRWMRRRFEAALERLAARFAGLGTPAAAAVD